MDPLCYAHVGPEKLFVMERLPLLRGYLTCISIYLDPQKLFVIERFLLLGQVCYKRFYCTESIYCVCVCYNTMCTVGGGGGGDTVRGVLLGDV